MPKFLRQWLFRKGWSAAILLVTASGLLLPAPLVAQTTTTAATVNFAGKVIAVNAAANTVTAEVQWLFGVAGASNASTSQTAILPVAYRFCSGKTITVTIPAGVEIISFRGSPMTLSQVQVGAFFNATANYQNGVATAKVIRFTSGVPNPPQPPPGFNVPPISTKNPSSVPPGSGTVNFAGKVAGVNASANSFSAEVRWFYGAAANTSQTQGFAIATHMCPSQSITVNVDAATKLVNARGTPISLAQVPVGAYFNATITWQNGVYTANVLRLTTRVPEPPRGAPANVQSPAPSSPTPSDASSNPPPPPACGFWAHLFGRC